MDCDRIALRNYLDGTLEDVEEKLEFLLHVEDCKRCRSAVEASRKDPLNYQGGIQQVAEETIRKRLIEAIQLSYPTSAGEINELMPEVTMNVLSGKLKKMADAGMIVRVHEHGRWLYFPDKETAEKHTGTAIEPIALVRASKPKLQKLPEPAHLVEIHDEEATIIDRMSDELIALNEVDNVLQGLDPGSVRRILSWVSDKYGVAC